MHRVGRPGIAHPPSYDMTGFSRPLWAAALRRMETTPRQRPAACGQAAERAAPNPRPPADHCSHPAPDRPPVHMRTRRAPRCSRRRRRPCPHNTNTERTPWRPPQIPRLRAVFRHSRLHTARRARRAGAGRRHAIYGQPVFREHAVRSCPRHPPARSHLQQVAPPS